MKKVFTYVSSVVSGMMFSLVPVLASTATDDSLANAPGVNLTIASLFGIIEGLACWATRFVTIVMVVMIVWYGFQMMAAQANETKFKDARKSLGYAVIGMIVVLGAYTIIATVGNAINSAGPGEPELAAKYTLFIPLSCGGY